MRHLPCLLVFLFSSGCTGSGYPGDLERYARAVEGAAGVDRGASPTPLPVLPKRRDRQLQVPDRKIGFGDFLTLQGCRLAEVVGERNSGMGKVMPPSKRLAYEHRFLEAAAACLPGVEGPLRAELESVMAAKRAELPIHAWNLAWASAEMEALLSLAGTLDRKQVDDAPVAALATLAEAARAPGVGGLAGVERALDVARDGPALGQAVRLVDRTRQQLDRVSAALAAVPERDTCDGDDRELVRQFQRHYVKKVQPAMAAIDQHARPLVETANRLWVATSSHVRPPVAMAAWFAEVLDDQRPHGLWRRYRAAVRRHAAAWGPILSRCGVI